MNNEKLTNLIVIVGSITIPYIFIQYQIYQLKQENEQLNKKLVSTIQQVASIKIEESKIETIFSHLRHMVSQLKTQRAFIQNITNTIRNQQRVLNDMINQLGANGLVNIVNKPFNNMWNAKVDEEEHDYDLEFEEIKKEKEKKKKKDTLEELGI